MCDQCNVLNINGCNCHEHGCPNSWQGISQGCKWCGTNFVPKVSTQDCCSIDCMVNYAGYSIEQFDMVDLLNECPEFYPDEEE
jgi:hypothetical protein